MTKKRKISYILLSFISLFMTTIYVAYASNIDSKYQNLEHYQSYVYDSNWSVNFAVYANNITNWFFSIAKWIASITDFFLKYLYQNEALDGIADILGETSGTIYENIFGEVGGILFIIAILFFIIRYFRNSGRAVKDIINFILVVGIGVMWVTNASSIIKVSNTLSSELQGLIASSGSKVVKGDNFSSSGTDLMREKAFEKMVEQPFLVMNFNSVDKNNVSQERIDNLAQFREYDDQQKYLKETELKGEKYNGKISGQNYYITDYVTAHKLTTAVVSIIMNILYMIPFSIIAFFSFIIQVQILFYILIVPFSILISLLPNMSSNYMGIFKQLFGLYVVKAMLGLVVLFIDIVMMLVNAIMSKATSGALTIYSVSTIIFFIALIYIYKKRSDIASSLSSNKYTGELATGMGALSKLDNGFKGLKNSFNRKIDDDNNNSVNEQPTNQTIQDEPTINYNNGYEEERTPQASGQETSNISSLNTNTFNDTNNNIDVGSNIDSSVGISNYAHSINSGIGQDNVLTTTTNNSDITLDNNLSSGSILNVRSNNISSTRTPQTNYSSSNNGIYRGTHNNIELDNGAYNHLLGRMGNDKEKLDSYIDYASESKSQGLYKNQTDLRRMEHLVSSYEKKKDSEPIFKNTNNYSRTKVNTPDYIQEQLAELREDTPREITENKATTEEMDSFKEMLKSKGID